MRKLTFFKALLLLAMLCPTGSSAECIDPDGDGIGMNGNRPCRTRRVKNTKPPTTLNIRNQSVQTTQTSATFNVSFSEPVKAWIKFGETTATRQSGPYRFIYLQQLSQTISGLKPNTTYYYRVIAAARGRNNQITSELGQFSTAELSNNITIPSTTTSPTTTTLTTLPPTTTTSTTTSSTTKPCDSGSCNANIGLPVQERISMPRDAAPSPGSLPPVFEWVDMPGNPKVEMMRISEGELLHQYSRRAGFTVNNDFLFSKGLVVDKNTGSVICDLPLNSEFLASYKDPDLFFGWSGSSLYRYRCDTNEKTLIYQAPASGYFGFGEGAQTLDDRLVAISYIAPNGKVVEVINLESGEILGSRLFKTSEHPGELDNADISPYGNYVLIKIADKKYRFDKHMNNMTELDRYNDIENAGHADIMLDANGREVWVAVHWADHTVVDLENNLAYPIDQMDDPKTNIGYGHISGHAVNRPGWAYASSNQRDGNNVLYSYNVFPGNSEVEFWGWSFTNTHEYNALAKMTVSGDGKWIMWSSNWQVEGGPNYTFVARVKEE